MVLEMRDGDKSKFRDKGILKAVVDIIDVIAHELLGMDVWEQAEIDRTMVEVLMEPRTSGVGPERIPAQRNSCHFDEVFPHTYISTLTGKPTDRFVMPVPSFDVISGGTRAGNCSACPEFSIVPTGASSVAEDMITDTDVFHTLKFGHQGDARRGACNVVDRTGFAPRVQLNSDTSDFLTESLELDRGVLPR